MTWKDHTLELISAALKDDLEETPVPVIVRGRTRPDTEAGPMGFDSEKTRSMMEGMGINIRPLEDLAITQTKASKLTPSVSVEMSVADLRTLLEQSDALKVEAVALDYPCYPMLSESTGQIGCPTVWDMGYTGSGITVGVLDTGLDVSTGDLNVKATASFVHGETEADIVGHGTHVAGIVGSTRSSEYPGVAPDATLACAKVLGMYGGNESDIARGVEWCIEQGARVLNLSLGGPGSRYSPMVDALRIADSLEVVVVASAGNEGPELGTVGSPGCCDFVITVGSVDKENALTNYSSRGPVYEMEVKPDILAPGGGIGGFGCFYSGGIISLLSKYSEQESACIVGRRHVKMSGTSMASPHIAGVVALLLQAMEEESIQPLPIGLTKHIKHALMATAVDLHLDPVEQGAGLVDVPAALDAIVGDTVPEEIQLPETRAPQANYGCSMAGHATMSQAASLATIQRRFVLPVSPLCSALITAAGRGSKEALTALNRLVPDSVVRSAVRSIARAIRHVPEKYVSAEVRTAVAELIGSGRARERPRRERRREGEGERLRA